MENIEKKEVIELKKIGMIALGGMFTLGYILGRSGNNLMSIKYYEKGVSDTLNSIIFKQK